MTVEERVAADPRYRALVRDRQRFAWTLCAVTAALYATFIVLIAFGRAALARPIGDSVVTVAVVTGAAMLLVPIVVCGVYVARANREFDCRLDDLLADRAR